MTPCYVDPKYEIYRVIFYTSTLIICFSLALLGRFYIGTEIEVHDFFPKGMLSFLWLGIGFIFYVSKFPERYYNKYECV